MAVTTCNTSVPDDFQRAPGKDPMDDSGVDVPQTTSVLTDEESK